MLHFSYELFHELSYLLSYSKIHKTFQSQKVTQILLCHKQYIKACAWNLSISIIQHVVAFDV